MTYEELLQEFKQWVTTDKRCQMLWNINTSGRASYKDADLYAEIVGDWWSNKLVSNYGDSDYSEVIGEITDSLKKAYAESAYYSKNVQKGINQKANIGMKPLEPSIDEDRIENLATKLIEEDAKFLLESGVVENIARSAVQDTIKSNARIQSKAGLNAYVKRDASSGCCKWCESMSGVFEYGKQPSDFWRVHKGCTCTFEYNVGKTKSTFSFVTENGKMRKR